MYVGYPDTEKRISEKRKELGTGNVLRIGTRKTLCRNRQRMIQERKRFYSDLVQSEASKDVDLISETTFERNSPAVFADKCHESYTAPVIRRLAWRLEERFEAYETNQACQFLNSTNTVRLCTRYLLCTSIYFVGNTCQNEEALR